MKNLILIGFISLKTIFGLSQNSTVWATVKSIELLQNNPEFSSLNLGVKKAFPSSRQKSLQDVYEFTCSCDEVDLYTSLHKIDGIVGIEYGPKYETLSIPNDYSIYGFDYALNLIKAPQAWDITTGDPNVVIAISDANYYIYHEELAGKIEYLTPDNTNINYLHGTAVATIAAGNTNNGTGKSSIGYDSHLQLRMMNYDEILEATYSGARIINLSWTSGCNHSYYAQQVIDEAYNNGLIIISSAGNGTTCGNPTLSSYPASYNHVISVTSVGPNKNHERFIGDPTSTHQHNLNVDISAPGYDVSITTAPGLYGTGNGTSFASPYVSGTVALMLAVNKCLTPDQVEYILKTTADSTIYNVNQNYIGLLGSGLLDSYKAVEMAKRFNTFEAEFKTDVNCDLGLRQAKVLNINGVLPLTFKWSNGLTTDKIEIDTTDLYSVEITDNIGCKFYSEQIVNPYDEIEIQTDISHVTCYGLDNASLSLEVNGGDAPYNFCWSNGEHSTTLTDLKPGYYSVSITDQSGCIISDYFTVNEPEELITSLNYMQPTLTTFGWIDLEVAGGTKPYSYQWNHGEVSEDLENIIADFYEVLVTDINGCMSSENIILNNTIEETASLTDLTQDTLINPIIIDLSGKQVNLDQASSGYYLVVRNGVVIEKIYKN